MRPLVGVVVGLGVIGLLRVGGLAIGGLGLLAVGNLAVRGLAGLLPIGVGIGVTAVLQVSIVAGLIFLPLLLEGKGAHDAHYKADDENHSHIQYTGR